ncbi:MAG: mevalonate kinase [Chloroflexota bacterium]|nr:mevalonate kinase [Chloroflexota bacterium]
MTFAVASSPGKVILFGEHGVHRGVPNITTAVTLRTYCRVSTRSDTRYTLRSAANTEDGSCDDLLAFKAQVDGLRAAKDIDAIVDLIRHDFYAPGRYVLSHVASRIDTFGVDVEWVSDIPIGSGLGSGAAANSAMVKATYAALGHELTQKDLIFLAWQGDAIAHGGYGSSLDSITCVMGGFVVYTRHPDHDQPVALSVSQPLPLVIGDTQVAHSTNKTNTHIRLWLEENPSRIQVFRVMGYLQPQFLSALQMHDLPTLGNLMYLHQLLQFRMGVSIPESDRLVEAAVSAGAYGAKISGSGGGGIIIAIGADAALPDIATAIDAAGGRSYLVASGAEGTRLEAPDIWQSLKEEKGTS